MRKRLLVFIAVSITNPRKTNIESIDKTSINTEAMWPFSFCAYSEDAKATKVSGNEYAHHTTLNLLIDFLNRAGLQAWHKAEYIHLLIRQSII